MVNKKSWMLVMYAFLYSSDTCLMPQEYKDKIYAACGIIRDTRSQSKTRQKWNSESFVPADLKLTRKQWRELAQCNTWVNSKNLNFIQTTLISNGGIPFLLCQRRRFQNADSKEKQRKRKKCQQKDKKPQVVSRKKREKKSQEPENVFDSFTIIFGDIVTQ